MEKIIHASVLELLIARLFKDFYKFDFILNAKIGAVAYDWFTIENKIELNQEIKNIIWQDEQIRYAIGARNGIQKRIAKHIHKEEELVEYYKTALLEYHIQDLLHFKNLRVSIEWPADRIQEVQELERSKGMTVDAAKEQEIYYKTKELIQFNQLLFEQKKQII